MPSYLASSLVSYIGNDKQTTLIYREAVRAGVVPDSTAGETKFSVMWTATVADLLRAGEWRFRAWQEFFRRSWSITSAVTPAGVALNMNPRTTGITSTAQALSTARTLLGQDMAKYVLGSTDTQAAAGAWAWALGLSVWPWPGTAVSPNDLVPAAPTPIGLVSPAGTGIVTPITGGSAPLPTPQQVTPSGGGTTVPGTNEIYAPPPAPPGSGGVDYPTSGISGPLPLAPSGKTGSGPTTIPPAIEASSPPVFFANAGGGVSGPSSPSAAELSASSAGSIPWWVWLALAAGAIYALKGR